MSVRRESSDVQTKLMVAFTGVLNSLSGVMGAVTLVGLALVIYLFSGFIGDVLSVTAQIIGAVLLLVLGFIYVCDAVDEPDPSPEDIASGMGMRDFILKEYRNNELKAAKILRRAVKENASNEESEASFRKQTLGLLYTHGALTVLMIVYAVCGFAPFLGFLAVVAGSLVTLGTAALCTGALDMFKSKSLKPRTMRTRIVYWLFYGLPPLYVLVIFLSYIF